MPVFGNPRRLGRLSRLGSHVRGASSRSAPRGAKPSCVNPPLSEVYARPLAAIYIPKGLFDELPEPLKPWLLVGALVFFFVTVVWAIRQRRP